jgi:porin
MALRFPHVFALGLAALLAIFPQVVEAETIPQGESISDGLGDSGGVRGELSQAEQIIDAFRVDNRKVHLQGWYDWKKSLKDKYGFNFGINASLLYESASDVLREEDSAAGGIYRLQGDWMLVGRGTGNAGGIIFRVENRSQIGSGIPPASLRGEMGLAATDPGFAYSDKFGTDFAVLAWQQGFGKERARAAFAAGLLDFSAYLDAFYFQTIGRGFLNRSFILSPTVATTGIGAMGVVARGMINKNWWLGGGFYDANAKSGDPGAGDFEWDELLTHIEVGFTPSLGRRGTDRTQLTYWHKDELPAKGATSGRGWLLSWSWMVNDYYVPFVRAGYSDGGAGVLAKASLAGGVARRLNHQDWLTLGIGWNKPSTQTHGYGLDDEKVLEASYLWQLTANTSLLFDAQYLVDPALNPEASSAWVAGLRVRLAL